MRTMVRKCVEKSIKNIVDRDVLYERVGEMCSTNKLGEMCSQKTNKIRKLKNGWLKSHSNKNLIMNECQS